jgi:hypothetical protein
MKHSLSLAVFVLGFSGVAFGANTLLIGHDTNGPVREYTTAGAFIQSWGVANQYATGSAVDGSGNVVTVNPAFGNNVLETLSAPATSLGTVTAAVQGQWVEDMDTWSSTHALAGTYEGNVFLLDYSNGADTFLFSTGHSYIGVTGDGTGNIWTTGGLTTTFAYYRDITGAILSSFDTGAAAGGLTYDPMDGTLYIGTFGGVVNHFTTTGTLLGSFSTGINNYIDGIGLLPEPTTAVLLGVSVLVALRRRR